MDPVTVELTNRANKVIALRIPPAYIAQISQPGEISQTFITLAVYLPDYLPRFLADRAGHKTRGEIINGIELRSNEEIEIDLRAPVYVHLTYQTTFIDDNGELVSVPDIYGYDARMIAAQNTVRPALTWPAPKPRIEQPWSTRLVRLAQRLADRIRTIFPSEISTLTRL